jgi:transposase
MQHQTGTSRNQMQFISLEDRVAPDNPVRVIDAFVESLPLKEMGFKHVAVKSEGRPPYSPSVMLKLYLYGYSGGVRMRSSRKLEAESKRNVELMWLIEEMSPSHMSIAHFRSEHAKELKSVFKRFGLFLKDMELISGEVVAIDSTKIRGQNSKGNNHTEKDVKQYLKYLNEKSEDYLRELDAMDKQEAAGDTTLSVKQEEVKGLLEKLKEKKEKYTALQSQMKQQQTTQVSTTDVDTRLMQGADGGNMVGLNIQGATDAKHYLIADFEVTNEGDRHALYGVATSAKETLGVETLTALADKGYHSGTELAACEQADIITLVASQQYFVPKAVPDERYNKEHFIYDKEQDCYTCPEGHKLVSNGTLLKRDKLMGKEEIEVSYKDYKTTQCSTCPVRHLCTTAVKGRVISRFEYQEAVDANNKRVEDHQEVYARRKCIAEHPFGTIKRSWGYTYTLLKGIKKVSAEMALIFTCYNLRRAISIMGVVGLVEALNTWKMPIAA